MATVKELYDLIKEKQRNGEKIGILQQSIVDAYEAEEPQTTKEVSVTFIKTKKEMKMATIKGVYEELKKMKRKGEDIGMFGESFIEMYEKDQEPSTTKEVHVTLVKNKKDGGSDGKNN